MHFIAHRGLDKHNYRENTIKALNEALKQEYIDGVELDVRISKDNKLIIYHNMSYVRKGVRKFVKNIMLRELEEDGIDSLEVFLNKLKTNKIILLDIKDEFNNNLLIKNLLKLLKKYSKINIWICSFNYNLVNKLTNKSKYNVGLIIGDIVNKGKDINQFNFVSVNKKAFNDINTDKMKMVWTINSKKELNKVKNVDYIITNKAYLLV